MGGGIKKAKGTHGAQETGGRADNGAKIWGILEGRKKGQRLGNLRMNISDQYRTLRGKQWTQLQRDKAQTTNSFPETSQSLFQNDTSRNPATIFSEHLSIT